MIRRTFVDAQLRDTGNVFTNTFRNLKCLVPKTAGELSGTTTGNTVALVLRCRGHVNKKFCGCASLYVVYFYKS